MNWIRTTAHRLKHPREIGLQIRKRLGLILPTSVLIFALLNCSPKTTSVSLPVDSPESFAESGMQPVPERWWIVFEDAQLNALVDSALNSNFNLKTAWERLRAAQAVVDRESSRFFPRLDGSVRAERNRSQSQFRDSEVLELGLSSEYEIDLWGQIRSGVDAERFRARASYADYQTAALSLTAEIVRTWYQLAEAQSQLQLANEQVETNEQVLRLIKARFGSGLVRGVDILRQQQLLEATTEQKIAAEVRVQMLQHQLAVLLGQAPRQVFSDAEDQLPSLPPLPETGVPVELVQRRPDVQSAYNLLQAADLELAAAISSKYPRLNLTASISTAAINADKLFDDWAYSVAGSLLAPIFYGGQIKAEVDRSEAVRQQRLYEYGQAVLTAFREVEDALLQEQKQAESIESLESQVRLSKQTYEQLQLAYFNGMSNYLDVLTALDEQQRLQRNLLAANLELLEYRIALYRALAGGFETKRETVSPG
jgi:NodT family efflux transporter outer membrane factor (OMF) lipoprotein